jgi:universal stress protein E
VISSAVKQLGHRNRIMNQHRRPAGANAGTTLDRPTVLDRGADLAGADAGYACGASVARRFRRVLAVCDDSIGSDDVLIRAISVARANGARLTVVRSLAHHPGSSTALDEMRKHLSRIVPWIVQEGVGDVSTDVLVGPTDVEVCRYVLNFRHDLVIAGADVGRRRTVLFRGRPAASLMRRCPCAVWIVKEEQSSRSPVLAAVDATPDGPIDPLDLEILGTATTLAKANDVELHVVHSWEVEDKSVIADVPESSRQSILDKCKAKHGKALESLLVQYRGSCPQMTHHLPRGDPQTEIARLARDIGAGLVVMGTTCRVGMLGMVLGSAAGTVLSAAPCSVLAVKSNHFRTSDSILKVEMDAKFRYTGE